ncbi:LysR family transcriptional regulator [Pseudoneobacillus rhizosphaerae]|uniref:HTH-type transcriptional regulator CynR n=1 Tax=Pseudoneobacillus rhizosphaerae TaxID=2880968 RepID=A0A9C7GC71_9BACI|nr:LysR family transcriptional regulator [Pseudoneobacillus rhizosphaerae]CAG9609839.1 HTH-type transcriptional regulator CynR [Pseudoneobacillus rhizosphaerae]
MDERDWKILDVLFEQKNITKSAEILFVSQPALTKRLMQIEEQFGVKIVDRGIRGVQFTSQGEYLAHRASQMLTLYREIKEDVSNMNDDIVGTLRIGVTNFFGKYILPEIIQQFTEKYPKVSFQVETGVSKEIFNLTYSNHLHIGLVRGDYSWPDQKLLLFNENVVIASKSKITLEQLPDLPRVDFGTDHLFKSLVDNWWNNNYPKPPQVIMKVDRGDTCKEMVTRGIGYSIMPHLFFQDKPDIYQIPLKDKDGTPILRPTWMFYHESSMEQNVVKAFVEFIKEISI